MSKTGVLVVLEDGREPHGEGAWSTNSEKEQVRGWSDTCLEMTSHQAAEQGFAKDQQIK